MSTNSLNLTSELSAKVRVSNITPVQILGSTDTSLWSKSQEEKLHKLTLSNCFTNRFSFSFFFSKALTAQTNRKWVSVDLEVSLFQSWWLISHSNVKSQRHFSSQIRPQIGWSTFQHCQPSDNYIARDVPAFGISLRQKWLNVATIKSMRLNELYNRHHNIYIPLKLQSFLWMIQCSPL
jgi:hypothetical protein